LATVCPPNHGERSTRIIALFSWTKVKRVCRSTAASRTRSTASKMLLPLQLLLIATLQPGEHRPRGPAASNQRPGSLEPTRCNSSNETPTIRFPPIPPCIHPVALLNSIFFVSFQLVSRQICPCCLRRFVDLFFDIFVRVSLLFLKLLSIS